MKRVIAAALIALTALSPAWGCGPYPVAVRFFLDYRPGVDSEAFVAGRLGILEPRLPAPYLVLAYRHLAGLDWSESGRRTWLRHLEPVSTFGRTELDRWQQARARLLPGERVEIRTYRPIETRAGDVVYQRWVQNCYPDAFRTAARTLEARVEAFGWPSETVREWVRAQDQVFANCHEAAAVPEPLPPSAPALARADREYQRAAASFYARRWDEAGRRFWGISEDRASPWRTVAHYLVARTLWRAGRAGAALWQLERVLGDPELGTVHADAAALRRHLVARREPARAHREVDEQLLAAEPARALQELLADHLLLGAAGPPSDLDRWLRIMGRSPLAARHGEALEAWRRSPSLPWTVAALATAAPGVELPEDLIAAARAIERESPAYPAVAFHLARWLGSTGSRDRARRSLDALLETAGEDSWVLSDVNRIQIERSRLAETLEEALTIGQLAPVEVGWLFSRRQPLAELRDAADHRLPEDRRYLPRFLVDALNWEVPAARVAGALAAGALEPHLARRIALAQWTRGVVLEDWQGASRVGPFVGELPFELPAVAGERSGGDAERRFEAALAILRLPGLAPFVRTGVGRLAAVDERDRHGTRINWWCPGRTHAGSYGERWQPSRLVSLGDEERAAMAPVAARLESLEAAPILLGRWVLDWAEREPADPRLPEALHRVVWSTRWGCAWDEGLGAISKAAFERLHRDFPRDAWTEKTPHWFD